ncbi:MAG TPA: ABC transporter substrate-binding protein [Bacilli bacterium]|nr:ABC transporter substrate-binding protein [Bacilli bacterium]
MKNTNKILVGALVALTGLVAISLTNESAKAIVEADAAATTLKIYNWEDYIYEPEQSGDDPSVVDQFIAYYKTKTGITINVQYDTFSTNEEMYNTITLSGTQYDLLIPSEYMIERLIREDRIMQIDAAKIPNYTTYASPYLQSLFEENDWDKYAAGYMWGTLGILYNTEKVDASDMNSWSILWNEKYQKQIALKDSMREGYLIGLLHVYHDELLALKAEHELGTLTDAAYNAALNGILNNTDDDALAAVGVALKALKSNIYGTEVDQGKNDMVRGTISINTAWSGDAVYAIYQAADSGNDVLRYAIPDEGSNIWYDAFVMPKGANAELAHEFIDFVSNPEIAVLNMDYIGYTPFIAGDSLLEYVLDYDEVVVGDTTGKVEVDLTYFFKDTLDSLSIDDAVFYIEPEAVGGQLSTQYPSEAQIVRSIVFRDFGTANEKVIEMWAEFKATEGQVWMYIVAGVSVVGLIAVGAYFFINKNKSSRRKRNAKRK